MSTIRKTLALVAYLLATPTMAEDVNKTIDAAPDGHVDVSNIAGSVEVKGWSRDVVEVTGTLGSDVKELIVERDGDTVKIKVKVPRRSGRNIRSDLHINVPANSSIDVGTVSADIDVAGVAGEQELASVSGDVVTRYTGAEMSVESVSGDVDITGNKENGELEVSSVSGNVTLHDIAGEVAAESVSGDVRIDDGAFDSAELASVSGNIDFAGLLRKDGDLSFESVSGNIDVELLGKVSANFEIDTFNGRIRNCFGPKAERTSKYAPGWELEFTEGDGDGEVEVSTLNGGIMLCKK